MDDDAYLASQRARLEAEKQSIMACAMSDGDKQKLLGDIDERAAQLERERQERLTLAAKIRAMESKLLSGQDIVSTTTEQQRAIDATKNELAEQKV